jgi:hypothetical protein
VQIPPQITTIAAKIEAIRANVGAITAEISQIAADIRSITPDVCAVPANVRLPTKSQVAGEIGPVPPEVSEIAAQIPPIRDDIPPVAADIQSVSPDVAPEGSNMPLAYAASEKVRPGDAWGSAPTRCNIIGSQRGSPHQPEGSQAKGQFMYHDATPFEIDRNALATHHDDLQPT